MVAVHLELSVYQVSLSALGVNGSTVFMFVKLTVEWETDSNQIITQTLQTETNALGKMAMALGTHITKKPDLDGGLREV